jgi:nucleotide-binding universal stress UspA family protein
MTHTVLVPLDGSKLAESVLEPLGGGVLGGRGTKRHLVRVVPDAPTQAEQEEALDQAGAYLEAVAKRLEGDGIECSTSLERGDPADGILTAAAAVEPDLIVMSTHGHSGVTRWLRGSVAERVLRSSPTPLLVLNPAALAETSGGEGIRRILVPLDGSELADRVLPMVEGLALARDAMVTLLRVQPFAPAAVPSPILQPTGWDPRQVEGTLALQKQRLEEAGVRVEIRAAIGNEAAEIVSAAADSDLVAMTTHGRSGPSRWWFGSVAEQVVRHCDCPLLLLRVPAPD